MTQFWFRDFLVTVFKASHVKDTNKFHIMHINHTLSRNVCVKICNDTKNLHFKSPNSPWNFLVRIQIVQSSYSSDFSEINYVKWKATSSRLLMLDILAWKMVCDHIKMRYIFRSHVYVTSSTFRFSFIFLFKIIFL